jgi:hypothetical protein
MVAETAIIGAGVSTGVGIAGDVASKDDEILACLRSINDNLIAIRAYDDLQRERVPYVAELSAVYVNSVPTQVIPWQPASTFRQERIIVSGVSTATGDFPIVVKLSYGTHSLILPAGSGVGNAIGGGMSDYIIPKNINGGQDVTFQSIVGIGAGLADFQAWVYIVGWYEVNRPPNPSLSKSTS